MTEHRFRTPDGVDLDVDIPAGDVAIETVDGEESVVTVEGSDRLVEQTEVELRGRTLVISFRGRKTFGIPILIGDFSFGGSRLRVRATVPHGARASVATASADVRVSGRLGSLEVRTASGELRARGEVEGDATVKTVSGDVRMERVDGSLKCTTVSGDVEVDSVGGSVEARTVSGDVRVVSVREGEARFTSVSGDVEIGIAPGSLLDVDAGSVSGDLTSEVPLANAPVSGAGQEPTVVLRGKTVSGDVKVFRAS
jgi:Putative adhesin